MALKIVSCIYVNKTVKYKSIFTNGAYVFPLFTEIYSMIFLLNNNNKCM